MNKIKNLLLIMSAVIIALLVPMEARAASDIDYGVYDCGWEADNDHVSCVWETSKGVKMYRVVLYRRTSKNRDKDVSRQKVKILSATGKSSVDVTDIILKTGTGYYFCYVYADGHYSKGAWTDDMPVDSTYIKTLTESRKLAEKAQKELQENETQAEKTQSESVSADSQILSAELRVTDKTREPGQLVKPGFAITKGMRMANISYSVPEEQWRSGEPVMISFELIADDGHSFTDSTSLKVSGAELQTFAGDSGRKNVTIKYVPRKTLSSPEIWYLNSEGKLVWYRVEDAGKYYVQIIDDGVVVKKSLIETTSYDVSEYLGEAVSVSIQAIAKKDRLGVATDLDSSKTVIDNLDMIGEDKIIDGRFSITDNGLRYYENNVPAVGWKKIAGYWYCFDSSGYAEGPGRYTDADGNVYCFDSKYRMIIGKNTENGVEYTYNDGSISEIPLGALVK